MGNSASLPAAPASAPQQPAACTALAKPRSWTSSVARTSILAFLESAIQVGQLVLVDAEGTHRFGTYENGANFVQIRVADDQFWQRVFVSGDLGFSESYMMGEVHVDDDNLKGVMDLWLENESTMSGLSSTLNKVTTTISGWSNALFGQTVGRARLNAVASYDQSNELFMAFLSKEMMYSCALWGPEEGGVRGDLDPAPLPTSAGTSPSSSTSTLVASSPFNAPDGGALEAAQQRKLHHVLGQLRLKPGHRLLEFGSGWGGLAITAAAAYGVEVDTLTLSGEQKRLAEERVRAAGLEGRVRVHLMDYRELPLEWEGAFDAFVSIEMLEHVGAKHYNTYFQIVDWALKAQGATAVVSASTFPEARFRTCQADDFMRKYMWPNSALPSASALVAAAHAGAQGRFTLEGVENHAAHYPRTLREWGRRLEANLTPAALGLGPADAATTSSPPPPSPFPPSAPSTPTTVKELGALLLAKSGAQAQTQAPSAEQQRDTLLHVLPPTAESARRADYVAIKRKWQYLFAYAAAGFAKGYIACHMLTFVRGSDCPEACA